MSGSEEMFYMEDGVKKDAALHKDMLDNKDAEDAANQLAVEQAVRDGMPRKKAEALFL